jgi:hypothetical protein
LRLNSFQNGKASAIVLQRLRRWRLSEMALVKATSFLTVNPRDISRMTTNSNYSGSMLKIVFKNGEEISISDRDCNIYDVERKLIDAANSD